MNFSSYIFTLLFLLSTKVWRSLAGGVPLYPKDVLFLIDGSGSVKPRNFDKLRVILKNMIDGMNIGPGLRDGTHVALIQFSSRERTKVEFNLDTYDNKEDMKAAIDNMVYQRRYTYTGYAMQMAEREVSSINDPSYRANFDMDKKDEINRHRILKLVKLQSLVAKCCKIRKI